MEKAGESPLFAGPPGGLERPFILSLPLKSESENRTGEPLYTPTGPFNVPPFGLT